MAKKLQSPPPFTITVEHGDLSAEFTLPVQTSVSGTVSIRREGAVIASGEWHQPLDEPFMLVYADGVMELRPHLLGGLHAELITAIR